MQRRAARMWWGSRYRPLSSSALSTSVLVCITIPSSLYSSPPSSPLPRCCVPTPPCHRCIPHPPAPQRVVPCCCHCVILSFVVVVAPYPSSSCHFPSLLWVRCIADGPHLLGFRGWGVEVIPPLPNPSCWRWTRVSIIHCRIVEPVIVVESMAVVKSVAVVESVTVVESVAVVEFVAVVESGAVVKSVALKLRVGLSRKWEEHRGWESVALRCWVLPSVVGLFPSLLGSALRSWGLPSTVGLYPLSLGFCPLLFGSTFYCWALSLWHLLSPLWNPWLVEITGPKTGPTGENIWLNQEKYLVWQVFFGQTGNSIPGNDPGKITCDMSAIPGWV